MRAIKTPSYLSEKRNHTPLEFSSLCRLQYFFEFSKKKRLLLTVSNRPILKQTRNNRICQLAILFYKLNDAVRKLLMIHSNRFRFMKRYKCPHKKQLMLFFQW
ncbi:hypothetical protein HanRHA438_Chr01g0041611 [Helianthus annuus]|uniref:Uncharacterized protein n=1 Tax=Helianthus annuus TaxID=4232 RepID=A0A9K3JYL3_HELAN|nr:hypothetical protein HanXRQr2_Chr01g0040771 [Helianthus annuus]KAJ0949712.1 hypothetical protein HanRHA438_Chr01g0041611 [Helianthus annuus]KAJ0958489.1 hypothetical protein HanPSC8_Chr01g0039561 [Helianthus annuus]